MPVIRIERLLARQRQRLVKASLLAAAAVILISAVVFHFKSIQTSGAVARFQTGPDTAFTLTHAGDEDVPEVNVLAEGSRLRLASGSIEGRFASGVRCVVEAPCDLTVLENNRISMKEGVGWRHLAEARTGGSAGSGVMVGWAATEPSSLHPFPPVAGQPSQALSLRSGASVLNRTGTRWASLQPGDKLTLTIALGEMAYRSLNWNEETFFGLTDAAADLSSVEPSDTVANSGIIRNNPATGTQSGNGRLSDVTLVHTVTEADLKRPGRIGILIFSSGVGGGAGLQPGQVRQRAAADFRKPPRSGSGRIKGLQGLDEKTL